MDPITLYLIKKHLDNHAHREDNPHKVTKEQIGLGNVDNVRQASKEKFDAHLADKDNPHNVTKAQVGLGNVDNVKQASKDEFDSHVANQNNPHAVTKEQVGLGNVQNYGVASQDEAEAGTATDRYMTPQRTKQAIDKFAAPKDHDHSWDEITDKPSSYPPSAHTHTKAEVGLGDVQNYGIATQAEAEEGTATDKYMTPQRVKQAIDANAAPKDHTHAWNEITGKPSTFPPSSHTHTKSEVGLGNVENHGIATQSEAEAGTSNSKYMTPLRTKQAIDKAFQDILPKGAIIMWSGSVSSIPNGWALCDGNNGTPDLRNRFIVGAGGEYAVGDTGGAKEVTLTVDEIPAHTHSGTTGSAGSHTHSASTNSTGSHTHTYTRYSSRPASMIGSGQGWGGTSSVNTSSAGAHTHTVTVQSAGAHTHSFTTDSTGGGKAHENRPPYYALCFIMKL